MTDLSDRDLSRIPDSELTPEEREELQRRLNEFLARLRVRHGKAEPVEPKAKRIQRWDPATVARRH